MDWEQLLERAPGGHGVAADPGDKSSIEATWPVGPSPAAAEEAVERLISARTSPGRKPIWVFLVGSAGNGKSYLASRVADAWGISSSGESSQARRVYLAGRSNESGRGLVLVNDATIPSENAHSDGGPLAHDLLAAIERDDNVLVCINRGIVLKEQQELKNLSEKALIQSILSDLLSAGSTDKNNSSHFYRFRQLDDGTECHFVAMDGVSLLEKRPQCVSPDSETGQLLFAKYSVMRFSAQHTVESRKDVPYFTVLKSLGQSLPDTIEGGMLRANRDFLKDSAALSGFCQTIRAAELVSGSRFSYRDLWSIAVIALLGTSVGLENFRRSITSWEGRLLGEAFTDNTASTMERLSIAANSRIHMAIFGGDPIPDTTSTPILSALYFSSLPPFHAIDPSNSNISEQPTVTYIEDALLTIGTEESLPSHWLKEKLPAHPASQLWSDIDEAIERGVVKCIVNSTSERLARQYSAWLFRYLCRFYMLAEGIVNEEPSCDALTTCWQRARTHNSLTPEIENGLLNLMLSRGELRVPIMGSLANPILSTEASPQLVARLSTNIGFTSSVLGDHVLVTARIGDEDVANIPLDANLIREARNNSKQLAFVSNISSKAQPLIERARASIVHAGLVRRAAGITIEAVSEDRSVDLTSFFSDARENQQ